MPQQGVAFACRHNWEPNTTSHVFTVCEITEEPKRPYLNIDTISFTGKLYKSWGWTISAIPLAVPNGLKEALGWTVLVESMKFSEAQKMPDKTFVNSFHVASTLKGQKKRQKNVEMTDRHVEHSRNLTGNLANKNSFSISEIYSR